MMRLVIAAGAVALVMTLSCSTAPTQAASVTGPSYDDDGKLVRPRGFRSWVAVGASLGLSYREGAEDSGPGEFKNVYLEPSAYAAYRTSGEFPEGTMLALAVHETLQPDPELSIGQEGHFPGKLVALEMAVKDSSHIDDGWAYFDFGGGDNGLRETAEAFGKDRCFDCHAEHAADDNVFVQFYPVLRDGAGDE